ncbi:lipopolysaccharide biosynthesis protein [Streptosporangium sp. NPDC048047]|uniref:lipopolysaccharide biosynthesis protein n=1 Tax=Streptosporangium sp. NPDC048047 TaxID=3155748 RepID=UPI00341D19DF
MAALISPRPSDRTAPASPASPVSPGGTARAGLAGLAGAGAGAAAQFATVVLVTRETDRQTAGAFFTATALCLTVAGILRLDAGNGLIRLIARSRPLGYGPARGYVRAAFVPVAALSLAAATVTAAVAALRPADPASRVLAVALPAVVCAEVAVAATRGFGAMRPTVLLTGLFLPSAQLAGVALVLWAAHTGAGGSAPGAWIGMTDLTDLSGGAGGAGMPPAVPAIVDAGSPSAVAPAIAPAAVDAATLTALAVAWVWPYAAVLAPAALWLRRRLPRGPRTPGAALDLWRDTWPRSAAAALQSVFQRLDVLVVAALAGPAEAAVYTAATRFKVVGQLAGQGLAHAVQPRLVRALSEGDLPRARALYQSATMWLVAPTWPIWLGYAVLAPWLLGVFGDGYASGVPVALVLAGTMMAATACGMADVALSAAGHTRAGLANLVAAVATTVALDALLVPSEGVLGAALGWSGGTLVKNLLPLWRINRLYGLRPFGAHSVAALTPWRSPWRSPRLRAGGGR